MQVAVVTDSTCDLPPRLADEAGLRVVPLTVAFGDAPTVGRTAVEPEEFYRRLATDERPPTTSQPSGPAFVDAWVAAADAGAEAIVSLHVSGELSGTVDRARSVATSAPVPVTVIDSRQVSCGLALQALAAARAAAAGGQVDEVVSVAAEVSRSTTSVLALDTIAHLRRGGRVAAAQSAVDSALRVRPLMTVRDGRIEPLDRARTWRRAIDRLVAEVAALGGDTPVDVVVGHALAADRAGQLARSLAAAVPVARSVEVVFGPVVGTHTGPGAVGVAAAPSVVG